MGKSRVYQCVFVCFRVFVFRLVGCPGPGSGPRAAEHPQNLGPDLGPDPGLCKPNKPEIQKNVWHIHW